MTRLIILTIPLLILTFITGQALAQTTTLTSTEEAAIMAEMGCSDEASCAVLADQHSQVYIVAVEKVVSDVKAEAILGEAAHQTYVSSTEAGIPPEELEGSHLTANHADALQTEVLPEIKEYLSADANNQIKTETEIAVATVTQVEEKGQVTVGNVTITAADLNNTSSLQTAAAGVTNFIAASLTQGVQAGEVVGSVVSAFGIEKYAKEMAGFAASTFGQKVAEYASLLEAGGAPVFGNPVEMAKLALKAASHFESGAYGDVVSAVHDFSFETFTSAADMEGKRKEMADLAGASDNDLIAHMRSEGFDPSGLPAGQISAALASMRQAAGDAAAHGQVTADDFAAFTTHQERFAQGGFPVPLGALPLGAPPPGTTPSFGDFTGFTPEHMQGDAIKAAELGYSSLQEFYAGHPPEEFAREGFGVFTAPEGGFFSGFQNAFTGLFRGQQETPTTGMPIPEMYTQQGTAPTFGTAPTAGHESYVGPGPVPYTGAYTAPTHSFDFGGTVPYTGGTFTAPSGSFDAGSYSGPGQIFDSGSGGGGGGMHMMAPPASLYNIYQRYYRPYGGYYRY